MLTGIIKVYKKKILHPFGFILMEDETEVYFSRNNISDWSTEDQFVVGASINFQRRSGSKGYYAVDVSINWEGAGRHKKSALSASVETKKQEAFAPHSESESEVTGEDIVAFLVDHGLDDTQIQRVLDSLANDPTTIRSKILTRMMTGDFVKRGTFTFRTSFKRFTNKVRQWSSSNEYVNTRFLFFEMYGHWHNVGPWMDASHLLVIRRQTYRSNYYHSVFTLLHYHVAINSNGNL